MIRSSELIELATRIAKDRADLPPGSHLDKSFSRLYERLLKTSSVLSTAERKPVITIMKMKPNTADMIAAALAAKDGEAVAVNDPQDPRLYPDDKPADVRPVKSVIVKRAEAPDADDDISALGLDLD